MYVQQKASLIGTWKLTLVEARHKDGSVRYPWGQNACGLLTYTQDGYMSAVIMRADRPHFLVSDLFGGSVEEQAQAARTYLSYCGTYEIQGDKVIHYVEMSLFPNWIGKEQVRFIDKLTNDELVLRTHPNLVEGQISTGYLVWHSG